MWANGNQYEGQYQNDRKHGQGTLLFQSGGDGRGWIYIGEFRDDKRDGSGTLIRLHNGLFYKVRARNDKIVGGSLTRRVFDNLKPEIVEVIAEHGEITVNGDPGAQMALGMMYMQGEGVAKDWAEAVKWLRKADRQHHPFFIPQVHLLLGNIYLEGGEGVARDPAEAAKFLRLFLKREINKEVRNDLGYALLELNRTSEAIAVFEENVQDFPGYAYLHDSLGDGYRAAGQLAEAKRSYEQAVELGEQEGHSSLSKFRANLDAVTAQLKE